MRIAVPLLSALFALPVTPHAHHSTSLNFSDEIISIEGQIKSVRWVNPHCSFVCTSSEHFGQKGSGFERLSRSSGFLQATLF